MPFIIFRIRVFQITIRWLGRSKEFIEVRQYNISNMLVFYGGGC
jgi:hypothetical protein